MQTMGLFYQFKTLQNHLAKSLKIRNPVLPLNSKYLGPDTTFINSPINRWLEIYINSFFAPNLKKFSKAIYLIIGILGLMAGLLVPKSNKNVQKRPLQMLAGNQIF